MCRLRFVITSVLVSKIRVTGSSSSIAKCLPVPGPSTVTTTHLSFCGAQVMIGSRGSEHRLFRIVPECILETSFPLAASERHLVSWPIDNVAFVRQLPIGVNL